MNDFGPQKQPSSVAKIEAERKHHSASVELYLVVSGVKCPLSQVGPGFFVTRNFNDFLCGTGELLVSIDGVESRKPIEFEAEDFGSSYCKYREMK